MSDFKSSVGKGGGSATIGFPDVCKTPAPPAPFVPIPYPNTQLQENLKLANRTDAQASAGNQEAIALQNKAIGNLKKAMGNEAGTLKGMVSATGAVLLGHTLHHSGGGTPSKGK